MADPKGTTAVAEPRGVAAPASPTAPTAREDADRGRRLIEWSERRMPALVDLRNELAATRPLDGVVVAASLHITPETGAVVRALSAAGARIVLCGSNPLSTRDDIVASLREHDGVDVHAFYGEDTDSYYRHLQAVADADPNVVVDDGADLIAFIAEHARPNGRAAVGIEQTTTGVQRLRAMHAQGVLPFPVVALNDAPLKQEFDNLYGTGQNTFDGILRATNILIAGRTVVVAGYGWAGRGIAERARGMGAKVVVSEIDPVRALHAHYDGFAVQPMDEAARDADLIVTATGCRDVVSTAHLPLLKDGAILANSGHFDVEVDVTGIEASAASREEIRRDLVAYTLADGRTIYVLAQGRLVGQAAAEASPADVMDLTFTLMVLTVVWAAAQADNLDGIVLPPAEFTTQIAARKLSALGVRHDELTERQRSYIESWDSGT